MNNTSASKTDRLMCNVSADFARKLKFERDEAMEALDKMSAYIQKITGSCPYECFDAEPHSHPCSEVCDNFTDKINECWKKHFLNQTFFK